MTVDLPKILAAFADQKVAMAGITSVDIAEGTILNAGINFAYGANDYVSPFSRFVGASMLIL